MSKEATPAEHIAAIEKAAEALVEAILIRKFRAPNLKKACTSALKASDVKRAIDGEDILVDAYKEVDNAIERVVTKWGRGRGSSH